MKIYFDGDSFTWGKRLVDPFKSRFSKLICDKLNAEEHNFSIGGASNQRIQRQLLIDNKIEEYDLAIIQMTFRSRFEYYDRIKRKFSIVNQAKTRKYEGQKRFINEEHRPFWQHYYEYIYDDKFGRVNEEIIFKSIQDHCAIMNIPLILITNDVSSELPFEYTIDWKKLPKAMVIEDKHKKQSFHPNEEGHMLICEHLLDIIDKKNYN